MTPTEPVDDLPAAIARLEGGGRLVLRLSVALGIIVLLGIGLAYRAAHKPPPPAKFITQPTSTGDVTEKVQATGILQPILQVSVGSQVSGRVTNVYVDFNSIVKKGDLLAEIDPTLLDSQVTQQRASLGAQRAQLLGLRANQRAAQAVFERTKRLFEQNLASQAELDTARGQFESTSAIVQAQEANLGTVQALLAASKTNVEYSKIRSEVDGVIVSRLVDPGTTVAASFQTPVLFVIAKDLRRMRVIADIDEADVGKLQKGLQAEAVVDAFPGVEFRGTIAQIRLSPNTVQGVVTYSAVLEVDNPKEKLRPGMTATVTIRTNEALGVVRVPNAALRFRPSPSNGPNGKPAAADLQKSEPRLQPGFGRVYLVKSAPGVEDLPESKAIEIGVTDGIFTEVRNSTLPLGAAVITDEIDEKKMGLF